MRSRREKGVKTEFVVGRTFEAILKAFEGCGYDVSWRVVNARHWLPQFRERVYIVGLRRDLGVEMDWDLKVDVRGWSADSGRKVRDILEPSDAPAIKAAELKEPHWEQVVAYCKEQAPPVPLSEREIPLDGKAPTLISSYHKVSHNEDEGGGWDEG